MTKPTIKQELYLYGKIFHFTGEWHKGEEGYFKAKRNKKIYYAPIYSNSEERIIDMTRKTYIKPENS
jgi:hypothetical protein